MVTGLQRFVDHFRGYGPESRVHAEVCAVASARCEKSWRRGLKARATLPAQAGTLTQMTRRAAR